MGAAMSYFRRYSLSALVGVVCDDEDDGETAVGRGKTPPKAEKISIHQLQSLTDALGDDDDYRKVILEHYKIKSLADLSPEQHQVCLRKALARRQEQLKTGTN
jgi:hypothetical protein